MYLHVHIIRGLAGHVVVRVDVGALRILVLRSDDVRVPRVLGRIDTWRREVFVVVENRAAYRHHVRVFKLWLALDAVVRGDLLLRLKLLLGCDDSADRLVSERLVGDEQRFGLFGLGDWQSDYVLLETGIQVVALHMRHFGELRTYSSA